MLGENIKPQIMRISKAYREGKPIVLEPYEYSSSKGTSTRPVRSSTNSTRPSRPVMTAEQERNARFENSTNSTEPSRPVRANMTAKQEMEARNGNSSDPIYNEEAPSNYTYASEKMEDKKDPYAYPGEERQEIKVDILDTTIKMNSSYMPAYYDSKYNQYMAASYTMNLRQSAALLTASVASACMVAATLI